MASKIFFSHLKGYFWISAFDHRAIVLDKMHIVQWWILIHLKVRHQDLHLALEMHLENMKHWNTKILRHLVALLDEVDLWQMLMMLEVMKWKRESRVIFHLHLQHTVPHPSPRGQLVAPRVQKTAGKERCQWAAYHPLFYIPNYWLNLSFVIFCHTWPTSQNEKKAVLKLLHTLW